MPRYLLALAFLGCASAQPLLPTPTGLDASDGAYTAKIGLAWEHVRGAQTYRVYRSEISDPGQSSIVGSTASILYFDSTAAMGQAYFYWVQAVGGEGQSRLSAPDQGFVAVGKTSAFGPIGPLQPPREPPENPVTGAKIYLGKALFWDEQLSSTRTVACGTCHRPRKGGSDPRAAGGARNPGPDAVFGTADDAFGSRGVPLNRADGTYEWSEHYGFREQVTPRKAQTVFEAAFTDLGLLWDGRALNQFVDPLSGATVMARGGALESQALLPILDTAEMSHLGRGWGDVTAQLERSAPLALSPSIPPALAGWIGGRSYPELFAEAFGTPEITPVRIAFALASYERTLFSDRTRIDAYAAEIQPMPADEARGRQLFLGNFCDECHRGNLIGDNRFRYIGVRPDVEDAGRFEVSRDSRDLGKMRTQSLRNVALRGPYMHTGGLATLSDVVEFYDRGGDFTSPNKDSNFVKRLKLTAEQKTDLLAFLERSLTDSRVAAEQGPLFDRPLLYTESARVPVVESDDSDVQVHVLEPPVLGNPSFTVAVSNALGGSEAVLAIDRADPGPVPPATVALFRGVAPTGGGERRHASISVPLPNDATLAGQTFFGRWYLAREGAGHTVSPLFRMKIFAPADTAAPPLDISLLSSLSAASFTPGRVSPESLVSGFGSNLSIVTEAAVALPLPASLAGVSIVIRDSAGAERPAALLYVSAGQINYQIPSETAPGEATVFVRWSGATIAQGTLQVARVAPALFAANANGSGPAAAQVVRITADGSQTFGLASAFDETLGRFVASPIDGPGEGEQVVLVLYGSGIRFAATPVTATIGGEPAEVLFAGRQPEYPGVDQANVRISPALAGRGEVEVVLHADGEASNPVRIRIR